MTYKLSWEECKEHKWKLAPGDWDSCGGTEEVECTECGMPGQRDIKTNEVFWPAT